MDYLLLCSSFRGDAFENRVVQTIHAALEVSSCVPVVPSFCILSLKFQKAIRFQRMRWLKMTMIGWKKVKLLWDRK